MLISKNIFEIAKDETIVFSNPASDVIISLVGTHLNMWFYMGNSFVLSDALDIYRSSDRIPIAQARKLASDWFDLLLTEFNSLSDNKTPLLEKENIIETSSMPAMSPNGVLWAEPIELGIDKKDAHTEHCCKEHEFCKYNNKKCTVLSGKKKASYSCKCGEIQNVKC